MSIRTAIVTIVLCAVLIPARARAVSLTLGADGAAVAQDRVSELYASRADGTTIAVARVGDRTADGGEIEELGVPSETSDGRVLFGASVEDKMGREAWNIFIADPNAPALDHVARAMAPLAIAAGCTPRLRVDPYPIATGRGDIAFMAPRQEGGDALFLYRAGRLDCLLRTGDRLSDGREVAGLSFGSVEPGAGDSVAMIAFLKRAKNDTVQPALWWRDHLQAVLLVSPQRGVTEVAVEGGRTPQGGGFGAFGLPAAAIGGGGAETTLAFTDRGGRGTSVYLYRHGKLARVLHTGSASAAGRVTFLSQGWPSLTSDGIIAVRAASGDRDLILLASGRAVRVVVHRSQVALPDWTLANLGDPWLVEGARLYFPAFTGDQDRFFALDASGVVRELEQTGVHETAFEETDATHHLVASGTLFANPRGNFTYLGGR
ncbi:MAG: hypothetical protein ACLQAT_04045 [Candidatus Binataceae bacterium]